MHFDFDLEGDVKRGFKAFLSYGRKLCFAGTLCAAYIEFKVGSLVLYLIVCVYIMHTLNCIERLVDIGLAYVGW